MKKLFLILFLTSIALTSYAKKVKFAVNMTGQTLLTTGVHITGDFQDEAGFAGGDWMSNSTALTQETADTNIYSIVVDLPAFRKYEYKFINGDQFYEAEFVPVESRIGYMFNDNRWIYVDSTSNDTSFVGAIMFGENAPKGYRLLRLKVDLQNETTVDPAGTHVGGSFQAWNPSSSIMYKLNDTIDELIVYVDTTVATAQFKYINGNNSGGYETVPGFCSVAGNRDMLVPKDTVLSVVCFSSCMSCLYTGVEENITQENIQLYPNPASEFTILEFENTKTRTVTISDVLGSIVKIIPNTTAQQVRIEKDNLTSGIYFVSVSEKNQTIATKKLIIQ